MHLTKHHLLLWPTRARQGRMATFHGEPHVGAEIRIAARNLLEDRHGPMAGASFSIGTISLARAAARESDRPRACGPGG